ncbi:hypothetical protein KJ657_00550 [Patescibacteria group bacterium]|nr:hypothetical protein [Patescibacteria group bacterium]MBU1015566.1 hypothetical protein [Patescibacteria group bacterium]MBU1685617.1 hypothetical protein [Patescibacteria group bacterium]MBU1938965.1 hypothetical protein [Patescibacteria group bacterium]
MLENLPGRQPDEKVIMVIRKHLIVYIRSLLVFLVAAIFPLTIFLIIWSKTFPLSQGGTVSVIGFLGASLYFLYSLALLVVSILNDEFDLFILTDHRLIDVTQVSFLSRTVATTPLNQIQDTTSDIHGILGTLLNYGSVDVQTAAGSASNFTIDTIPDPPMIARAILNQAEIRKEKELEYRRHIPASKEQV